MAKILREEIKNNSENLEFTNVTPYFPELSDLEQPRDIEIKLHNLDLKMVNSNTFKTAVSLSSKCDKSKLEFKIKFLEGNLDLYVAYNGNDANGYFVIESSELDKVRLQNDNGDIVISRISADTLDVKNDNGDIVIESVHSQMVDLSSSNGDIVVTPANDSKLILEAGNGDIVKNGVRSNSNSGYIIKCATQNGDIVLKK